MDTRNYFSKMRLALVAIVATSAMLFMSSCQKETRHWATEAQSFKPFKSRPANLTSDQERMSEQLVSQIPTVRLYDEANGRYMDINLQTRTVEREWTFADPTSGWFFVQATGVWENEDGTEFIVVVTIGAGSGTGGTVVAGGSVLDIDYTFCFTSEMDAIGLDLFDFGGSFDGVSTVVGIAGDFEALANDELGDDPDFEDFFFGFAMYIVYDGAASGTYPVLNWFSDLEDDPDYLDNHAFSFVIDFQDFAVYFSSDGTLQVSGGYMTFNGEYLAITEFLTSLDEDYEPEYSYVTGYGAMGCN